MTAYRLPEEIKGTILEEIMEIKLREVKAAQDKLPSPSLRKALERAEPVRSLKGALLRHNPAIIAEIKRASPSAGLLRQDFEPVGFAREYERSGAAAISMVTEVHHFMGGLEYLATLRWHSQVPLLRKDFLVDSYQILESRCAGADAILLIGALLAESSLRRLRGEADALGMDVLVEVHDERELGLALAAGASLIGVNSRDLRTFEVSLDVCFRLAPLLPKTVIAVAESGIRSAEDIHKLMSAGYRGFLIGEQFMRASSPGAALAEILSASARVEKKAS